MAKFGKSEAAILSGLLTCLWFALAGMYSQKGDRAASSSLGILAVAFMAVTVILCLLADDKTSTAADAPGSDKQRLLAAPDKESPTTDVVQHGYQSLEI
jgi:hypothetical protein